MKIRAQALQEKNRENTKAKELQHQIEAQEREILLKSLKQKYVRGDFYRLLENEIKSKGYSTYFLVVVRIVLKKIIESILE